MLDAAEERIEAATMTDARRQSLLRRIARARTQDMDARSHYALRFITTRALGRAQAIGVRLEGVARELGVESDIVRARYNTLSTGVSDSREAPSGYDTDAVRAARIEGLPADRGSIHAMTVLREEALQARVERVRSGPQRITHEQMPARLGNYTGGYDPDGGRLEIRGPGKSRTTHAYRNIAPQVWADLRAGQSASWSAVRSQPHYLYETQAEADLDAAARQCSDCGQFAASSHACPARPSAAQLSAAREAEAALAHSARPPARGASEAVQRPEPVEYTQSWRRRTRYLRTGHEAASSSGYITTPSNLSAMRTAASAGPVYFPLRGRLSTEGEDYWAAPLVSAVAIYDRPGRGQHVVTYRDARCACSDYATNGHCPHVDALTAAATTLLLPEARASSRSAPPAAYDPAEAQRLAERAALQDWMRSEEGRAEAAASWAASTPEDTYSTNPAAFNEDVKAALDAKKARLEPIEYLTDNATAGLCTPDTDRSFGVELEFDLPSTNRRAALQAIGQELYAAGLTRVPYQEHYHAGMNRGYTTEHQGGWSFENDCTVSGEIVSPVMKDTPETWANLAKVCEIVNRHGGKATARTGSHVHVSTPSSTVNTATSLARMVNQNEDVMYRISQNPKATKHRPRQWCGPNTSVPPSGYSTTYEARGNHLGHYGGLNLASVQGEASDHAEIRHWDGSLNPAVIQMQVTVSAALVAAAEREGAKPNAQNSLRGREEVGSHDSRNYATKEGTTRKLTETEQNEDTATARSFADTLFNDRASKARFAALFAITKWQK